MINILFSLPKLRINSDVHVTVDGNSIYTGVGGSPIATLLANQAPFLGSGCTPIDRGIGGSSWNDLITKAPTTVDNTYVSGKTNILIVGEWTNSTVNHGSETYLQTCSYAQSYITGRRAANPDWIIILCGPTPLSPNGGASWVTANTKMHDCNDYCLANYQSMGADYFVDFHTADTPCFNNWGTDQADFTAYSTSWYDNPQMHPSNVGKQEMCKMIIRQIKDIPRPRN